MEFRRVLFRSLSRCLLCNYSYANVSSLTRHVRKHHEDTFRVPFDCPECQRTGETRQISALPAAWSNHDLRDRKSVVSGKSVSVRVDLGWCRIIKKQNNNHITQSI